MQSCARTPRCDPTAAGGCTWRQQEQRPGARPSAGKCPRKGKRKPRTYRGSSSLQLRCGGWRGIPCSGGRAGCCGPGREGQGGPARLMGPSAEQGAPGSAPDTQPCKTGGRGQCEEVPRDLPSPEGTAHSHRWPSLPAGSPSHSTMGFAPGAMMATPKLVKTRSQGSGLTSRLVLIRSCQQQIPQPLSHALGASPHNCLVPAPLPGDSIPTHRCLGDNVITEGNHTQGSHSQQAGIRF